MFLWIRSAMSNLHQFLLQSPFGERYLALKKQLPRVKHLIHGGTENYYAGLHPEHLQSAGCENRLSPTSIERTITNVELGLGFVMGVDLVDGELYLHCHPRPTDGEKTREAVWQYDLFADYRPVAALGLNFHIENAAVVATVANVQGHDPEGVRALRDLCSGQPWPVANLSLVIDALPSDVVVVRGVPSTKHPFSGCEGWDNNRASNLYDMTFRKIGMVPIRGSDQHVRYYELSR